MSQNAELQEIASKFAVNDFFERDADGNLGVRHMVAPNPLEVEVTEPTYDADGNPILNEYGDPVLRTVTDEDGQPIMRALPWTLGTWESLDVFKTRVGL